MRVTTEVLLTDREQAFVVALTVAGHRPTRAAVESGWSASNARHLLRKEHIICAIAAVARNSTRVLAKLEKAKPAS
ncbi:MAG TPA: hypothetical protein VGF43_20300 [Dongiaceae bacterium]|jgi:hypothetical protein